MNKFNRRVTRLFIKTHVFFPRSDFEMMRDYWKAILKDNNATPEQYAEECAELFKLKELNERQPNEKYEQEKARIFGSNPQIQWAYMYNLEVGHIADNQYGFWLDKILASYVSEVVKLAKRYFKDRERD